jgi:DNA recombination protein RmuC
MTGDPTGEYDAERRIVMSIVYITLAGVIIMVVVSLFTLISVRNGLERMRAHMSDSLLSSHESSVSTLTGIAALTQNQLEQLSKQTANLSEKSERQLLAMREAIDNKLELIRSDNERKLEQMRVTVDEKLHETLERRLGESFKVVSDQLSVVNRSLGEMQNLADGVGDLKRVLSNVKSRGMLGEFQLHAILQDILSPDQYAQNVATKKGSGDRVEFAVRLPGQREPNGTSPGVWLPIDAKFPKEDYERLLDAQNKGDAEASEVARKAVRQRLKSEAKDISTKYLDPPATTDFAVLFLPLEGLYAEVLNTPGLVDELQRTYRVVVAGPTTLTALLNSLHMGFKTLAIQKRSSEVWQILGSVKTEFSRFGELLDKTKKRLDLASGDLDLAYRRTERIQRKLVSVETDPSIELDETEEISS